MGTGGTSYGRYVQPLLLLPGALFGLFLTDFFPVIGTGVGALALVGALAVFFLHGPRWLVWLLGGVVLGTLILWALALRVMANPGPGAASGSGSAR